MIVPYRENPNHVDATTPHVAATELLIAGSADALLSLQAEDKRRAQEREQEIDERGWRIGFGVKPPPPPARWLVDTTWVKHSSPDCPALLRAAKSIEFAGKDADACPGRNCMTPHCRSARA